MTVFHCLHWTFTYRISHLPVAPPSDWRVNVTTTSYISWTCVRAFRGWTFGFKWTWICYLQLPHDVWCSGHVTLVQESEWRQEVQWHSTASWSCPADTVAASHTSCHDKSPGPANPPRPPPLPLQVASLTRAAAAFCVCVWQMRFPTTTLMTPEAK